MFIFWRRVGKYTKHEFEVSLNNLTLNKKTERILVFFKNCFETNNLEGDYKKLMNDYEKVLDLKKAIEDEELFIHTYSNDEYLKKTLIEEIHFFIDDIKGTDHV